MFEALYLYELEFVHYIQALSFFEGEYWSVFWQLITEIGNPKWTFTVYFPLLFFIVPIRSLQMLMAGVYAEFLNGILKWLLFGDRPYWYLVDHHLGPDLVTLKQFPATCETGPGCPSGHVMVTTAVFYVLLVTKRKYMEGSEQPPAALVVMPEHFTVWRILECIVYSGFNIFAWLLSGIGERVLRMWMYLMLLVLVALSRLYIAAHFPHQVVLALIAGIVVAEYSVRYPVNRLRCTTFLLTAIGMLLSAWLIHSALFLLNIDPDWSIERAKAACANPDWIHVTTTPWSTIFRDLGCLVGLSICHKINPLRQTASAIRHNRHGYRPMIASLVTLVAVQIMDRIPLYNLTTAIVYLVVFIRNIAQIIVVVIIMPRLFSSTDVKEKHQKHK